MAWDVEKPKLMAAGFSETETQNIALGIARKMQDQGNSPEEMTEFFGKPKEPEAGHISEYFNQQFRRNMPMQDAEKEPSDPSTMMTAVKAGLQNSVLGLRFRGALPSAELEQKSLFFEGAPTAQRVAQGITQTIADLPVMGIGALTTPNAPPIGAFAVPQALRAALMKSYDQGGVHSFSEFMDVAKETAKEGGKGAITGAITGGAGSLARAATASASVMAQTLAPMASELTAMTTTAAALEGHMPQAQDFVDNAIVVGGLHALTAAPKLKTIFKDTGLHPHDVATQTITDPVVKQEMLGVSNETPNSLEALKQPEIKSDFVIADGKLVSGDDPRAQQEMKLEPVHMADFIKDNEQRFAPNKRLEAARLHDPAAFKAIAEMDKTLREGKSVIFDNERALEFLKTSEKDHAKLQDIRDRLSSPEITQDEFYKLTEQETALQENEAKLNADKAKANSLRNQNQTIKNQLARVDANGTIKARLAKAWQAGQKTLESNMKDRLKNKKIILPDLETTKVDPETFNPEFTQKDHHTPELTPKAKEDLSAEDSIHFLLGDENRTYSDDEMYVQLLDAHPDIAEKIAPELVTKETSETGGSTLKIGPRPARKAEPTTLASVIENVYNDQHRSKLETLGLEKQLGQKLPFSLKPEELVVKSRDSRRLANTMISKEGVFNPITGEKTSDSLVAILGKVKKGSMDEFRQFAIYKHAIDLNKMGELTGVNDAEAKAFVRKHAGTFEEIHKAFVGWHNAVLQYAADGGLIKQDLVNSLKEKYPNYTPTNRLTEEMDRKSSSFRSKVVYAREGSELPFLDPVAAAAEKAFNIVRQVEENTAKVAMVNADALREGEIKLLKEVGAKQEPNLDEEFKDPELNSASFVKAADERTNLSDKQVGYFDKGVYKVMEFHDEKLAKTLKFMGYDEGINKTLGHFLMPLKLSASMARFGVSGGVDFAFRHFFRSEVSTTLVSDKMRVPVLGTIAKLGEAFRGKSDLYNLAEKSGALHGVMSDLDGFTKNRDFVMGDKEGAISTAMNILKTPFSAVHAMMRIAEEAKRLSGFEARMKDLGPDANWSDVLEAGWATRKDSVDGLQRGAKMQALNMITAFQHYELQGLGRTVEAWVENPARMAVRSAMMTAVSTLLWYSHHDDDEYNSKPNYEKNAFWHVKVGNEYLKLAKPWGPGYIFASLPERLLELQIDKNPRSLHEFEKTLGSIIPLHAPTILSQWQALHQNYNALTDRQIIPQNLMNEAPESRRMAYTSDTAVGIAKALTNIPGVGTLNLNSPMMVDHAINMWTGQMGRIAVQGVDKALQTAGITEAHAQPVWNETADVPFLGGFISRHENYNAQPVKDFQEEFKTATQNFNSWQTYQKAGKYDEADRFENEHPEVTDYKDLQAAHKMITEQGKMIQNINLLPVSEMSITDRQQQIPDLWKTMIVTAKTKLDELDQNRKNVNKGNP